MTMPFARSIIARRPNAPSRSRYSANRRNVMSDRALPILIVVVGDMGKHASPGGFRDELLIGFVQQHDYGAGSFLHHLVDQTECVL
jgi:hypothetical protein